jgi:hypothetical protein
MSNITWTLFAQELGFGAGADAAASPDHRGL